MNKNKKNKKSSFNDVKISEEEFNKFKKKHAVVSKAKAIGCIATAVALIGAGAGTAIYFGLNRSPIVATDKYIVTFDSNGGTYVDSIQVEKGKTATAPLNPTMKESVFEYWYLDSEDSPFDFNTPITGNIVLHAKWGIPLTENGLVYKLNDDAKSYSVYADRTNPDLPSKIKIPEKFHDLPVTKISNGVGLISVFGEVSYAAFEETSIEEIEFPDTITEIDHFSFQNCYKLKKVKFPKNCTYIGQRAFYGCANLNKIEFNDNLLNIDEYAFCNCKSLETIKIPSSLYSLGRNAFTNCTKLKEVDLNNCHISSISGYCFSNCTSLEKINIPASVTTIYSEAFRNCKLTDLKCNDIYSGWIDPRDESGETYFKNDEDLASYLILNNISDVYKGSVEIDGNKFLLNYIGDEGDNHLCSISYYGNGTATSIRIPSSADIEYGNKKITLKVVSINNYSFYNGGYTLQSIELPKGIEKFEDYAFYGCTALNKITFYDDGSEDIKLKIIGNNAFEGSKINTFNSNTTGEIILPEGLKSLGNNAFYKVCDTDNTINKLYIPSTLIYADYESLATTQSSYFTTRIPTNPFYSILFSENSINIEAPNNELITVDQHGIYSKDGKLLLALFDTKELEAAKYTVQDGVKGLTYNSLANFDYFYTNITTLTLSNSVTNIEPGSLRDVDSLELDPSNENFILDNNILYTKNSEGKEDVAISLVGGDIISYTAPSTLTKISKGCFAYIGASGITIDLTPSTKLTEIESGALPCREVVNTLKIPASVNKIGDNVFFSERSSSELMNTQYIFINSETVMNLENNDSNLFRNKYQNILIKEDIIGKLSTNSFLYNNFAYQGKSEEYEGYYSFYSSSY